MTLQTAPHRPLAARASDYATGDVYAFKTTPITEFSPRQTGRYAGLKILGHTPEGDLCYAVLDGVFSRRPRLADLAHRPVLVSTRFDMPARPAVLATDPDWGNELQDFTFLGRTRVRPHEAWQRAETDAFGVWSLANAEAEGEWRWRHDRPTLEQEVALRQRLGRQRVGRARAFIPPRREFGLRTIVGALAR